MSTSHYVLYKANSIEALLLDQGKQDLQMVQQLQSFFLLKFDAIHWSSASSSRSANPSTCELTKVDADSSQATAVRILQRCKHVSFYTNEDHGRAKRFVLASYWLSTKIRDTLTEWHVYGIIIIKNTLHAYGVLHLKKYMVFKTTLKFFIDI